MSEKIVSRVIKNIALTAVALSFANVAAAGWTTLDGKVIDPNGNPFIFRGVTINHNLAPDKAVQAIKDAAALGANAVQVEIALNLYRSSPLIHGFEMTQIIETCKASKVVCVLEPNDVAGYPGAPGSTNPIHHINYWSYGEATHALIGQQDYVMIGLGNQMLSGMPAEEYVNLMLKYIGELRSKVGGFMLLVDGSNWGQDSDKAMHLLAKQLSETFYRDKVIFSVDMFDNYVNPEHVRDYIASFSELGAPLVIGGFAPVPYYHPFFDGPVPQNVPRLPAEAVMQYAEQYGAGYFGWSWSGNENPALDLVSNWDANLLTNWGDLLFNSTSGIKATAKLATHFSSNSSSVASSVSSSSSITSSITRSSSSSSVPNTPPTAVLTTAIESVSCGQVYGKGSAVGSTDPDGDTLSYRWEVRMYDTVDVTADTTVSFPMRPVTNYTVKLIVSDGKGGTATASKILSHSYSDNCIGSSSSSSFRPSSSSIAPSSSAKPSSVSSSSVRPSSIASSTRSSSSIAGKANCSYVIGSQWGNGFTAAIRVKNTGTQTLNGWSVNWQYADGSKVTNSWNASFSGSNPYNAKNLSWNANIQPGQTVEFGFQGSKPSGAAAVPAVTGSVCQ